MPRIYRLYATIIALLAHALFGPRRIPVLGPDSSLAALILAIAIASFADTSRSPSLGALAMAAARLYDTWPSHRPPSPCTSPSTPTTRFAP